MSYLIHEHTARVRARDGTEYRPRTCADVRGDGTWSGWIEFVPAGGRGIVLSTEQETSQPDRKAVEYWAGGLEPVYLEGALERALKLAAIRS
ncbi:MAG TPA: hypothetical protein VGH98_20665 [Gemmatimonadaceae bacterium]|jgi:hypothetical protein